MKSIILEQHILACQAAGFTHEVSDILPHICSIALKENLDCFPTACGGFTSELIQIANQLYKGNLIDNRDLFISACYKHIRNYRVSMVMRFSHNCLCIAESEFSDQQLNLLFNIGVGVLDVINSLHRRENYFFETEAILGSRENIRRKSRC